MELWIRVQKNKQLNQGICKVDNLFVYKDEEDKDKWIIKQWGCDTLGIYKTEKRALEVLDEIQDIFKPLTIKKFRNALKYNEDKELKTTYIPFDTFENTEIQELTTYVYEMPEE